MKIGVITVNYHSDEDTLGCLSNLQVCQVPPGIELAAYVVDNSKSGELKKKLEKISIVSYLTSPGNIGFAAGNNIGLKKSLADNVDIIVMINNDTIVPKNFILNILSSPITEDNVGAVGGLIYFAKGFEFEKQYTQAELGKVIWYAGGKYDWDNVYASHVGVNEVDNLQYNKITETDFITGCLFVTKSDVLKKAGLFDERYCLYFEDSDLGLRIKSQGYKLIFDPNIKLWHKVAQSSAIGSPLNDYFLTRNRLLFGFTYAKLRTKIALVRESLRKIFTGTAAQKQAIKDFYTGKLGWGSWKN